MITIDDFSKVELKVGTVIAAEDVEGSQKLIKLQVDLGEDPSTGSGRDIRQILTGLKPDYQPEQLLNKQLIIISNLEPRKMMGIESQGMLLAADGKKPILLKPASKVPPGTKVG